LANWKFISFCLLLLLHFRLDNGIVVTEQKTTTKDGFMNTKITTIVSIAIAVAVLSPRIGAQTVTFTSANNELQGLSTATPGSGATATFVSGSPGYWQISSPDNVGGGGLATFNDTAMIIVNNGYDGATLGTLSYLLAQGAAGNVSFNLSSMIPGNQFAYWDVLLTDPNDPHNQILIANAYSDNTTGANPFNQGAPGNSSVDASVDVLNGTTFSTLWAPWTSVETMIPVAGDPTLANWNVSQLGIAVGGWDTSRTQIADITSVTVPGDPTDPPALDTAWTLPLLGACVGGLAVLRRRCNRV
jgi:hypothetical protein